MSMRAPKARMPQGRQRPRRDASDTQEREQRRTGFRGSVHVSDLAGSFTLAMVGSFQPSVPCRWRGRRTPAVSFGS